MTIYHKIMGSGPSLVLLPGWGFHSAIWTELIAELQTEFTLHLFDLPGFGKMQDRLLPNTLAEVVDQFLNELPAKAHYIGWSLGGLVWLKLASLYPSRVLSLLTVGTTPCFLQRENWNGVSLNYFSEFYQAVEKNPCHALQQFILFSLGDRPLQKKYYSALKNTFVQHEYNKQALLTGLNLLKNNDLRSELRNIACPLRCLIGELDPLTPKNTAVQYQMLNQVGHFPMVTHTQTMLALIKGFYANGT